MVPQPSKTDPTLVSEMLAMSPEQRLRQNDYSVTTIEELRSAFAAKRTHDAPGQARR